MKVLALRAEHAAQYRELMLHAYQHAPDAFTSTPEERAAMPLAWWVERAADPAGNGVAFGAFADEQLVGTVAIEFSPRLKTRHKAHLIGMYVLDSWRGKGVGRQLVDRALEHVKADSAISLITLTVTEGNAEAIALYTRAGFQVFGIEPMAMLTPSGYKGKVHMWREVACDTVMRE